jgi:hypothetical protein
MARLLAKGWAAFCVFAGAHALMFALGRGVLPLDAAKTISLCTLPFAAMGLLFVGGYAAATDHGHPSIAGRMQARHFVPGFNDMVFVLFAALSFANQVWFAPQFMQNGAVDALKSAIYFAVPGQRALDAALEPHGIDGGRLFASAFAWLLAIIFLASAVSRLRLAAGIIRLERAQRPEALGGATLALLLGLLSVTGIQFLFVGTAFTFLPGSVYTEIPGTVLIGLGPLALAYLIFAALANLFATGPE